ncbi:MAG: heme o synthase [Bacteroidetes bacterium]|nr:heme o synthase [Bacteroidota bacterium]
MKQLIKNYSQLVKLRLTASVVATSAFGYILGCKINNNENWTLDFSWVEFLGVFVGGLLIVFSSNALNQLVEIENDGKMSRTARRPLVEGRISIKDARVFSMLTGLAGIILLALTTTFTATLLGFLSLLIYVFIYTPMKQVSPFAVMIGAIPGALPPLIGYTAVIPSIDQPGIMLFLLQFLWQFPHFWAIAWLLHDDYQKAGYWLLPSGGGRDKKSGFQIMIYTVMLCLVALMPVYYKIAGVNALLVVIPLSFYFLFKSWRLFQTLEIREAKQLLYASLLYTPLVFLSYIIL